jgi:dipeptidyl aminopeptidase/acylaminoacyl peptidase
MYGFSVSLVFSIRPVARHFLAGVILLGAGVLVAAPARAEENVATADEMLHGAYPIDLFTITPDGSRMVMEMNTDLENNGRRAVFNTETWEAADGSNDDIRWDFLTLWRKRFLAAPDGKSLLGVVKTEGKTWIGLRDPDSPAATLLMNVPLDMWAFPCGYSKDKKGIYVQLFQGLPWDRKHPDEDNPPTEDIKVRTRVSRSYFPFVNRSQVQPAYPGAYARRNRFHVVYLDLQTKELRRVLSGNDAWAFLIGDSSRLLVQMSKELRYLRNDPTLDGEVKDVFVIDIPPADQLPLFDIKHVKEAEALVAGWSDHNGKRIEPRFRDMKGLGWMLASPDGKWVTARDVDNEDDHVGYQIVFNLDEMPFKPRPLTRDIDISKTPVRLTFGEEYANNKHFGSGSVPCWTPDAKALLTTRLGYLWRIPVDGSPAQNLTLNTTKIGIRKLVGGDAISHIADVTPAGEVVVITSDDATQQDGLALVNLSTGQVRPIVENAGYISHADFISQTGKIYYSAVKPTTTVQIFVQSVDAPAGTAPRQLSNFQPHMIGRKLAERQVVSFKLLDGEEATGVIFYPPRFQKGQKVPLIIVPDGFARDLPPTVGWDGRGLAGFFRRAGLQGVSRAASYFTNAGYAVMIFDLRLNDLHYYENIRPYIADMYDKATDAALATGNFDASKLAVFSHGAFDAGMIGNFTLMALSQSNRFKAAAINEGHGLPLAQALFNDTDPWMNIRWMRHQVPRKVNPVKTPQHYLNYSAIPMMGAMKAPTLFTHTLYENIGPQFTVRVDEMYNAAQFNGTKNVATIYKKPVAQNELFRRVLLWFNEHLYDRPAVAWRATLPPEGTDNLDSYDVAPEGQADVTASGR